MLKGVRENEEIMEVPCLWYDSLEAVREFISKTGNEFWRDRIIKVENVIRNGTAQDMFAVMVGVGQYANHYAGIKRSPNARIEVKPEKGFNQGSVVLVAQNRNATGIAAGSEVLLNYGCDARVGGGDGESGKRLKGALDALFAKQLGEGSAPSEPKTEEEAKKAADEAEAKKNADEEAKKEQAKKKTEEEAKSKGGAHGQSGDLALGSLKSMPVSSVIRNGAVVLLLDASGNKKIPPGTILHIWTNGTFQKATPDKPGAVVYAMTPGTKVVDKAQSTVLTMSNMVKNAYPEAVGLWGFANFASKGQMPKTLVKKRDAAFFPTGESTLSQAVTAANATKCLGMLIVMRFDDKTNLVTPAGVALVTTSQVILKPGPNNLT